MSAEKIPIANLPKGQRRTLIHLNVAPAIGEHQEKSIRTRYEEQQVTPSEQPAGL